MLNRRYVLRAVPVMPLALGGCAGSNFNIFNSATVTALAADAVNVLNALQNVATALAKANIPDLPTGVSTTIANAITGAKAAVLAIQQAAPTTDPKDLADKVTTLVGYVNSISAALATLSFIPSPVSAYLNAAAIILPVLGAAASVAINVIAPPTPPPSPIPSVDAARAIANTPTS